MAPGGKRKGAGRPKGRPTKVLSVRVPAEHHDYLKSVLLALVSRLAPASPARTPAPDPPPEE